MSDRFFALIAKGVLDLHSGSEGRTHEGGFRDIAKTSSGWARGALELSAADCGLMPAVASSSAGAAKASF